MGVKDIRMAIVGFTYPSSRKAWKMIPTLLSASLDSRISLRERGDIHSGLPPPNRYPANSDTSSVETMDFKSPMVYRLFTDVPMFCGDFEVNNDHIITPN
jgi:hypothetical protein